MLVVQGVLPSCSNALAGSRAVAEEGDTTLGPLEVDESSDDENPVEAVRDDRAESGLVVPSENGVEDLLLVSKAQKEYKPNENSPIHRW